MLTPGLEDLERAQAERERAAKVAPGVGANGGSAEDSDDSGVFRDDAWPEPDRTLLKPHQRPVPVLPVEVFPAWWRTWIEAAAAAKSCPADYVVASLLGCAAVLIGNARWGAPWPGWAEPPVVWFAAVGAPSSGKSPGLDAARDVLETLEREVNADRPERLREWEADAAMAGLRLKAWETECLRCLKASEDPPHQPGDVAPPDRPRYRRFVTNDPTTEKVARLLLENPKGLLLFRDELAGWLGAMDKYGGTGSDRAFYLESYGGRRYAVDRVRDPEPIVVPALTLGLMGGIQPDRLHSLLLSGDDDGLVARFLWTWPDRVPPKRPRQALPDGAAAMLTRLSRLTIPENVDRGVIAFTDAAAAAVQTYRTETAELEQAATGLYLSWLGKLPGMAVRLAVLIEHLEWCARPVESEPPAVISERAAVAAIAFLDMYAVPMAQRCFGEASWPQADRDAYALGRWLMAQSPVLKVFIVREVRLRHAPLGREATRYDAAVRELVTAGWLRELPRPRGSGRPAKQWEVNPRLRGIA
jgi:Protein of unknown function (DUF3987)